MSEHLPTQSWKLESGDELRLFVTSPLETCTWAWVSAGECLVVDPGSDGALVAEGLADVHVSQVVCTHGHNDHVNGVAALVAATDAPFAMHEADVEMAMARSGRADRFGRAYGDPIPQPDRLLAEGDSLTVGSASFEVVATPGHTPGGIVLLGGGTAVGFALVGDTIFAGSHGRTDLPGGDAQVMDATLHRLATLIPAETTLLCGHGNPTTLAHELATTPFYR